MKIGISIDVDDIERAVDFYTRGLDLSVLQSGPDWAHLTHEGQTIFIMQLPLGSDAVEDAPKNRAPIGSALGFENRDSTRGRFRDLDDAADWYDNDQV
jgi:catechol 2,3-dioxygenase-like lactoylglutathione lyase family enzyme